MKREVCSQSVTRYMDLEERRRKSVQELKSLSYSLEKISNLEVFLADLILKKNEFEENGQIEKNEQTALEWTLTAAVAMNRQLALSCK